MEDSPSSLTWVQLFVKRVAFVLALGLALFHIYTAAFGTLPALYQRNTHLGVILTIVFLTFPIKKSLKTTNLFDYGLALIAMITCIYYFLRFDPLAQTGNRFTAMDIVMGTVLMLLLFEATRRTMGMPLLIMVLIFVLYCWYGKYLPGLLWHGGFSYFRVIGDFAWTTQGVFSLLLGVSATYLVMFVIFAAFMRHAGVNELFNNLGIALLGRVRGGPAQVAVISSCTIGMLTGSNVANVVTTGSVTIPLMKRLGFAPATAGAVEAVASCGGQIMPPIMGAGAFIMAEILGIPYIYVAAAALVPALMYYLNLSISVYAYSRKIGIAGMTKEEVLPLRAALKRIHLLLPLFGVIVLLAIDYTPMIAGLVGIITTIIVSYVKKDTRIAPKKMIMALQESIREIAPVAIACTIIGTVMGSLSLTGIGVRLGMNILTFAGDNLLLVLMLAMIISLILGMGAPTTAAYLTTIVVAGPILVQMGVESLTAHMFVFYFGCLSAITPPVAIAAYAAAPIAHANPASIGWRAFRLAMVIFIVPYAFIYDPPLLHLLTGGFSMVALTHVLTSVLGIIVFAFGIEKFFFKRMTLLEQAFFIGAGLLLISPWEPGFLIGIGFIGIAASSHFLSRKRVVNEVT